MRDLRCITWTTLFALAASQSLAATQVTIEVAGPKPSPLPSLLVLLEARSPSGETVSQRIKAPGTASLALNPELDWTIRAVTPGYWSPTRVLLPKQEAIALKMFPAAVVASAIRMTADDEMPSEMGLVLRDPRATDVVFAGDGGAPPLPELPEVTVSCPVVDGLWTCSVPAGVWDLRVRAKGFLSHYFWALEVPPGESVRLKPQRLERGASLTGRVAVEDGAIPSQTSVRLSPALAQSPETQADLLRFRSAELLTHLEDRGFFIFSGVAPGSYRLSASADGFVDAVVTSVPVLENAETEIAVPLILRRPMKAEFLVVPALDPRDRQWTANLVRKLDVPGRADVVGNYAVGEDGAFTVEGLAPGDYSVGLVDGLGNTFSRTEMTLIEEGGVYVIEVPAVLVEGEVKLGDSPLSAEVFFGGRRGGESIHMTADEEGVFAGYLPRQGLWLVEVVAADLDVNRRFPSVKVHQRRDGVAKVELALPNTFLQGRVVDEQAHPIPGAQLLVTELASRAFVRERADDKGEFVFMGLGEGLVSLEAEAYVGGETLAADMHIVSLAEDLDPGFQELTLRRMAEVKGRVVSESGGGVPGAWVVGQAVAASGLGLASASTTANTQGEFTLGLPGDAAAVDVWAMPMGCSLTHARLEVGGENDSTIRCNDDSGRLEVKYPPAMAAEERSRLLLVLAIDGSILDLEMLTRWAQLNTAPGEFSSDSLVVPQMPAGSYSLCLLSSSQGSQLLMTGKQTSTSCSAGFLGRYGDLVLEVPN